jgi:LysR family glycine cleavage system transcriptional activator
MTLHLPPLAAFRAFAAVARAGSFTAAAEALHVSTSAVSHQIRALEAALGAPLLIRAQNGAGPQRTQPTEAGRELLVAVEEALARLSDACRAVHDRAQGARPNLTVAANHSVASLWLAPLLAAFAGQHPSVSWQMHGLDDNEPDMLGENLDLAIVRLRQEALRPPDRLLFAETMFPVCTPALGFSGAADALANYNLLEEVHGDSPELDWRHWLTRLGQPTARARIVRFGSFNQAIGAAIAGAGIALGRAPLVDADLAAGRLVRLFAPEAMQGAWVFALRTRPGLARDPHVAHLRDYLLGDGLLGEGHHHPHG